MNLALAEALWWFGRLPSDELSGVACDALAEGFDSPSLLQLACIADPSDPNATRLFERALNELGRETLSKCQAGRNLAMEYARKILAGQLSPQKGAEEIARLWEDCNELAEALDFYHLSDFYWESIDADGHWYGPKRDGLSSEETVKVVLAERDCHIVERARVPLNSP